MNKCAEQQVPLRSLIGIMFKFTNHNMLCRPVSILFYFFNTKDCTFVQMALSETHDLCPIAS